MAIGIYGDSIAELAPRRSAPLLSPLHLEHLKDHSLDRGADPFRHDQELVAEFFEGLPGLLAQQAFWDVASNVFRSQVHSCHLEPIEIPDLAILNPPESRDRRAAYIRLQSMQGSTQQQWGANKQPGTAWKIQSGPHH